MSTTLYIPGFGNQDDRLRKRALPDARIIQETLRIISPEQIEAFLAKRPKEKIKKHIMRRYPSTTEEDFEFMYKEFSRFQGLTPTLGSSVCKTKKAINKAIRTDCTIKLAGHSQGGLIAIRTIINNPHLLLDIKEIELYAPVVNYGIARGFHEGKEDGYLHRKGVLVRKEYIRSLGKGGFNLMELLLATLKSVGWGGKLTVIYSENDPVIPSASLKIEKLKRIYDKLNIIALEEKDHYLGYR